jgi:hypothetical protein
MYVCMYIYMRKASCERREAKHDDIPDYVFGFGRVRHAQDESRFFLPEKQMFSSSSEECGFVSMKCEGCSP